jgi:hypothetical protein
MSILTRFTNWVRPRRLNQDLDDETNFHIQMRTDEHVSAGMSAGEATKRATQQFGDVEAMKRQMRHARLTSVTTLVAITSVLLMAFWAALRTMGSGDPQFPALPAAPIAWHEERPSDSPPPPPPPPPSWEEFVAKVNTFGGVAYDKKNTR